MKNKILIVGGSHAEIPLIKAAQNLGYYVITTGNNLDGLGHKISDKYIPADFSNKNQILDIAKTEKISAIISGCNDFALLTTVWVAQELSLGGHDSYDTSLEIHIKDKYRKLAQKLNIKTPAVVKIENEHSSLKAVENLTFPIIIKPVDLTGGKGCCKCVKPDTVMSAVKNAFALTREKYVIAEEFIEGTNHGFSAFIQDKKVTFYFVDNEQYSASKYAVSGASTTTKIPKRAIEQLIKDCEKIANHLNLADGILHTQFILDSNHVPTILEVTRRAPGDLYIKFVEYATGVNYPELIVKSEMGVKVPILSQQKPLYNLVRHCIMGNKNGILDCVKIDKSIEKNIKHLIQWWQAGELIENKELYKAGIAFVFFDSEKEMEDTIPKLNSLISIELKEKVGV